MTLELPLMMELRKEKDKLKEMEKRTGFEYGWCIECDTIGPLYIMCMKCHGQGQSLTSTRKIHKNEEQEVHQLGNEDQDISEWLIDSGASVHVTNQETDLEEAKPTTQAVTIGNGNSMEARLIGGQKTMLRDKEGNMLELEHTLFIPSFKKKIISLSKLLDQGYQVKNWTKEYFELRRGAMKMIIQRKEGHMMYYFQGTMARYQEANVIK